MPRKNTFFEMQWTLNQNWFSVWGVRDYYTNLEQRAIAGAEITFGYILMVRCFSFFGNGRIAAEQSGHCDWFDVCGAIPGCFKGSMYRRPFS